MRTIWKFPVEMTDQFEILMPAGADVLTVQVQHGQPVLWAIVDPDARKIKTGFVLHGTGHPLSDKAGRYIGSFQLTGGALVFHLFEARI